MRMLNNPVSVILLSLLIQAGNVSAEPAIGALPDTFPGSGGLARPLVGSDLPPAYPEWPERPARRKMIPPPPGGPYMSSAMSDIEAFPADSGGLRTESRAAQLPSPFFKADMLWPETPEYARPELWIPEGGEYRFVPEEIVRQLESALPDKRQEYQRVLPYRGYPPTPPTRQPYYGNYR